MTFKIVMAGYNSFDQIKASLESVANQNWLDYEVCVVDDGSTDKRQPEFIAGFCEYHGWNYILRPENGGAMVAQYEAICQLNPADEDILVWVDLDDKLPHAGVLAKLDSYYQRFDVDMCYGSYLPDPPDAGCSPAQRYPVECEQTNDYRNAHKWGIQFNHLRSVKGKLYNQLDPEVDFKRNGEWFPVSADAAIMLPCLELAGGRYMVIREVMYVYTSDNPISEWRKASKLTNEIHDYIFTLPRKQALR